MRIARTLFELLAADRTDFDDKQFTSRPCALRVAKPFRLVLVDGELLAAKLTPTRLETILSPSIAIITF